MLPNSNFYIGIFQKDGLKIVPAKKKIQAYNKVFFGISFELERSFT